MHARYTAEQFSEVCDLIVQILMGETEPDLDPERARIADPTSRAFATAILEDALGMVEALE